jgi:DNA-binding Xre family transcriptional regulator
MDISWGCFPASRTRKAEADPPNIFSNQSRHQQPKPFEQIHTQESPKANRIKYVRIKNSRVGEGQDVSTTKPRFNAIEHNVIYKREYVKYYLTKRHIFAKPCFTFSFLYICIVSSQILTDVNNMMKLKKVPKTALAKALRLSRQQVSNILTGRNSMSVDQLQDICTFLGVKLTISL